MTADQFKAVFGYTKANSGVKKKSDMIAKI
jgi:hypothetical protein